MTLKTPSKEVRLDYVPAEHYASAEFAQLEKKRLWPRVWQMACRQEQVATVGDQIVYDICDESILIVRSSPEKISAFYNACPHRGRQLVNQARRAGQIICPFHGWRFALDGKCSHVPYRENWDGKLNDAEIGLVPVLCDTWGGFVFINLDLNAEPLGKFLGEAAERLDPYEFGKQRLRWAAAVETNANWKLALEAFNEAYHVQTTHPQLLPVFDDRTEGHAAGPHGYLTRAASASGLGARSTILKARPPDDVRPLVLEYFRQMVFDVRSIFSERDIAAASRIMTELPSDVSAMDAVLATFRFRKEAAEAAGVGWPDITPQQASANGSVWHIFPNLIVLTQTTASLWYRARPLGNGDNPERCVFEFWALERYAPGYSPAVVPEYYTDWKDFKGLPPFLVQDFANIPHMQKGVRSQGFRGARVNPVQERIISNFHAHLREMVFG